MKYIDNLLNKITMYRVVLYGLTALSGLSIVFSFLGLLSYSGFAILGSLLLLCAVCYLSNQLFSWIFSAQTNIESAWITAYILALILFPIKSLNDAYAYVLIGVISMLSKYVLAINKKHIFNPVAISLVLAGWLGSGLGIWWIGSNVMFIPVIIFGFLVLRKTKRFEMFFAFFVAALVSVSAVSYSHGFAVIEVLKSAILSGPILFFGVVMLTEPLTTPPSKYLQIVYGVLVGAIYGLDLT